MRIILLLLLGCSTVASEIKDLGVFRFRSVIHLEPSANRSDLIGFEIKLYPSGNITNGISFHKTNSLITVRDLPLSIPEGLIVMSVLPLHSNAVPAVQSLYSFQLDRGRPVSVKAILTEMDESMPPIPYEPPGGPLPTFRNAKDVYPEDQVEFFKERREKGLRRNE